MGEPRFLKNRRYRNPDGKTFGKGVWVGYGKVLPPGWDDLSWEERAQMMRVAVGNGITGLKEIKEAYNSFAEGGEMDDAYEKWLENEARLNSKIWKVPYEDALEQMRNDRSYDYRRFYELQKAEPFNKEYQRDLKGNAHYNDVGKSVYHPTASIGSYYSGRVDPVYNPTGAKFGEWRNNGHEYRMSNDMLMAGANPYDTFNYLGDAEDAGVDLRTENGLMFHDYREPQETFIGGVLPAIEIVAPRTHVRKFDNGGYKPSERIRDRISRYEGVAMTRSYRDPLSGRVVGSNASFESEAQRFSAVLPEGIREKVLANPELADNLFSYSYNVGAGNFKKRVVPVLEDYYGGKKGVEDVANAMWASGDKKLRGLQKRRAEEKDGVRRALSGIAETPQLTVVPMMGVPVWENTAAGDFAGKPQNTIVSAQPFMEGDGSPVVNNREYWMPEIDPRREKMENWQRLSGLMAMMGMENPLGGMVDVVNVPLVTLGSMMG